MTVIEEVLQGKMAEYIECVERQIKDDKLKAMFKNCYLNTLTTTTKALDDGSFFIITGDIEAMWLRDSSAQIRQYLPLAKTDPSVRSLFEGVIARQIFYISTDPYANAFNLKGNNKGHKDDVTEHNPWVWERKYEIDSLCYPVELAYQYWKCSESTNVFNGKFKDAVKRMLVLWKKEQRHERDSQYFFERSNCPFSDTLKNGGKGTPVAYTGMSWSGFRPSDDANLYGYNIPANMFLTVALQCIEEIAKEVYQDKAMEISAVTLKNEIEDGIREHAIVESPEFGRIYAYEVDGLGHYNLMDDANVPSLLSIPYFGYRNIDDEIYRNTRRFILSRKNPYFFEGKFAKGIGSPHTSPGYVWHIGLIIQALTAESGDEIRQILQMIRKTDAGLGYMHESFHPDHPNQFTRSWFAWANSLFAQLIIKLSESNSELLL